ncbi:hypothetical protein [Prevotella sp. AGR2160]|uniref:hypothetical protein n=1 Tax=Prevotella sp. AGR2160 TaxID=1280674 RepID=UPI0018CA19F8|nr:hypothetical protein [Prevotella sp. AGR2160]
MNIQFEYPVEYPVAKNTQNGTKKGWKDLSDLTTPSDAILRPLKPVSPQSLYVAPEPPEISVDCLITARFVTIVPLPDSPAWSK